MDTRLFDTLLEPTFVIDVQSRVLYCNEPASILADSSVRKILRTKPLFSTLFSFESPVLALENLCAIQDASAYQELHFSTASGKTGRIQITVQPFSSEPQTWLVYFRDVTLEETLQNKYRKELEQKEDYIHQLEQARTQLEDYSKNLEKMVHERTSQLASLNQQMAALLDSLGQGFFIFDSTGTVLEVASKACISTVEQNPVGKTVWGVLGIETKKIEGFKKWMTTVFAEMLPFEDLAPLAPSRFTHSKGREIHLEYYPLRSSDNSIEGVVVVATDVTELIKAQTEAAAEKAHAEMILNLIRNKRQISGFLRESRELLADLEVQMNFEVPNADQTFRLLHTLKGGAATFSIKTFAETCHIAETSLSLWREEASSEKLNRLKEVCRSLAPSFDTFVQENTQILGRALASHERFIEAPVSKFYQFAQNCLANEPHLSANCYRSFQQTFLMEPVCDLLSQNNEVLQSVAEMTGKLVLPLRFKQGEFLLLPEPYESLLGTLVHAFRNAVDHGIETPQERRQLGKPEAGQITIGFHHNSKWLMIQIWDDGQGINPERIRQKQNQLGHSTQHMTDKEVLQLIFAPSFSTREEVTEVSGRGVGMDAIAIAARELGGQTWVRSKLGHGTRLLIRVPWLTEPKEKTVPLLRVA